MVKYDNTNKEWDKVLVEGSKRKLIGDSWKSRNTLDSFAHDKQRKVFLKILKLYQNPTLLTLGDGRYGNDAKYFIENGIKTHASDIADKLLAIANENGFINDFSKQNAEDLSFGNEQFDFIIIKEALHHCPRPQLAISEMLRCSRIGIFISEPRDIFIDSTWFSKIIFSIYKVLKKRDYPKHVYETVGNYTFTFSEREIEKASLSLQFHNIAFKSINTSQIPGMEFVDLNSKKPQDKRKIRFWKFKVRLFDLLTSLGLMKSLVISSVIFKDKPSQKLKNQMKKDGWLFPDLPRNQYL